MAEKNSPVAKDEPSHQAHEQHEGTRDGEQLELDGIPKPALCPS